MEYRLGKHSVVIAGRRTSVSLEGEFWDELRQIARSRAESMSQLITSIDADRQRACNLSSAIRLFVLAFHVDRDCQSGTREKLVA